MKKLTTLLLLSALVYAPAYSMETESDSSRTESGPEVLYRLTVEKDANGIPKITPTVIKDGVTIELPYTPKDLDRTNFAVDGTTFSLEQNKPVQLYPGTNQYIHLSPCGKFLLYSSRLPECAASNISFVWNCKLSKLSGVYLYELSSGKMHQFKHWCGSYRSLTGKFSPDGQRLLLFQPSHGDNFGTIIPYNTEKFPPKKLKEFEGQNPQFDDLGRILTRKPGSFSIHTEDGKLAFKENCSRTVKFVRWASGTSVKLIKQKNDGEFESTTFNIPDKKRSLIKRLLRH